MNNDEPAGFPWDEEPDVNFFSGFPEDYEEPTEENPVIFLERIDFPVEVREFIVRRYNRDVPVLRSGRDIVRENRENVNASMYVLSRNLYCRCWEYKFYVRTLLNVVKQNVYKPVYDNLRRNHLIVRHQPNMAMIHIVN